MNSADPVLSRPHAILLVDDNAHGMVARRRVLMDLGFDVKTATCGEEALKLVSEQGVHFDVIVTDYRMLSMNGIELIARVKVLSPATRTVLLSALVEPWCMTAESTGADAVIAKSAAEVGQLTRTVQSFFSSSSKKKPAASQKRAASSSVVKNG